MTTTSGPDRLGIVLRWPAGIALTSWRYMWRTTPLHRSEVAGALPGDAPPELPPGPLSDDVLHPPDGAGPLFHPVYRGRIRGAQIDAQVLIETIAADLDRVAPTEFASFRKVKGDERSMSVGDEYVVRMPGPWDGPVRVI